MIATRTAVNDSRSRHGARVPAVIKFYNSAIRRQGETAAKIADCERTRTRARQEVAEDHGGLNVAHISLSLLWPLATRRRRRRRRILRRRHRRSSFQTTKTAVHFAHRRRRRWCRIVAFWAQLTPVNTVDGLAVSVKFSSLIHKSKSALMP